jgi:hypothetical protein
MKDFRGNEIEVGDIVAYAWRRGSSMGLKQLKVVAVDGARNNIVGLDPQVRVNARRVNISTPANVVIVEKAQ